MISAHRLRAVIGSILALLLLTAIAGACARDRQANQASSSDSLHPGSTSTSASAAGPCREGTLVYPNGGRRVGDLSEKPNAVRQMHGPSRIERIDWAGHTDCERTVIEFAGSDSVSEIRAAWDDSPFWGGFVRIRLPWSELMETQIPDTILPGKIVENAYVVRPLGPTAGERAGLFVDLHLRPMTLHVRVLTLELPPRVVVNVEHVPYGVQFTWDPIPRSSRVVVLEPRGGRVRYPLQIRGYARTFEANVVARIRQKGRVVVERVTTAADWTVTWGEFAMTIPEGPRGQVELFVGEDSARDGTEEGVRIPLVIQ